MSGRLPAALACALRLLGGVAGIGAIGLAGGLFSTAEGVLTVLACAMLFFTHDGRGLPGVLSGQELRDARTPATSSGTGAGDQAASARPRRQ